MSSVGIHADSERLLLREVDVSLKQWGRWSATGWSAGLGYPSQTPFAKVRGRDIDDGDMTRIEEVEFGYTTWLMVTKASTSGHTRRRNLLWLFILRIHYCEAGAVTDKIHHTGRMFHMRLSRSKYYVLLREARLGLATLIY